MYSLQTSETRVISIMASSSTSLSKIIPANDPTTILPVFHPSVPSTLHFPSKPHLANKPHPAEDCKRTRISSKTRVSFFSAFFTKNNDSKTKKDELLEAIVPLDRGADATPEDQQRIDQVTADLLPTNSRKVSVKFDYFKILGLIPVKAPERTQYGYLDITYLDEDFQVSRGDKGKFVYIKNCRSIIHSSKLICN